jgi:hypothetical protein
MRPVFAFVAAIMLVFTVELALAATVHVTGGQVFLSHGEGYRRLSGSAQARPGDRVVVNPGGSGQIVYSDGCKVEVKPGSVAIITNQSPCGGGTSVGTGGDSSMYAIGAVVVGGAVGAAALLGKDGPSSP